MLKFEITEGRKLVHSTKRSGYKMQTGLGSRRWKGAAGRVYAPNGQFTGRVVREEPYEQTGDWGDGKGVVTIARTRTTTIAEVSPEPDRDLIERRTRAVYDALIALEG